SFNKEDLENIHATVKKAFSIIGCTGWGRVDFFIDNNKEIELIEINSIPGMTDHSLVPMSAEKNNLTLIELLEKILFNL
ncbi:MAG: D-alanine--D-alanine ligase, partial [Pseudomonadota bacterium]|nr:D-alanine--D-alanine ligase [Pseudomonadota bacterium]